VLEPIDSTATRLIVRLSGDYDRRAVALALALIAHPIHFAMQRRQLLNLKQRVERDRADRNAVPTSDGEAATRRRRRAPSASGRLG
jgi:hypothetical protein